MIDLKSLEAKCRAATPGVRHVGHISENVEAADIDGEDGKSIAVVYGRNNEAFFCAVTPDTVLKLIETIREYEEALGYYAHGCTVGCNNCDHLQARQALANCSLKNEQRGKIK
jgi:hypothetical protein